MANRTARLVLGDQLFPLDVAGGGEIPVFMAEDNGLCTHFRYHKLKLVFFLSAMRHYAEALRIRGMVVHYEQLSPETLEVSYEDKLGSFIDENRIEKLVTYEIEDAFMAERIAKFCTSRAVHLEIERSPLFLVSRDEFATYLANNKPFMKTFYEQQRRKTGLLMRDDGSPVGGRYSFDADNRKKLPKDIALPVVVTSARDVITKEVCSLVEDLFPEHPGSTEFFWIPVTHADAESWLEMFLEQRFAQFGDYQDAIVEQGDFVFHSALSPLINSGLLTPRQVLDRSISFAETNDVALNSTEGFVRQILGWREFVRGIYHNFSEKQEQTNFWNHSGSLGQCWYDGTTGIPPIDDAIQRAQRLGYNHHIERLMVLSSAMLLCEIHPQEVHRWFMEMYVDSADWVMGPNVYGMGQFSDGGIFATKPYICGSNYIRTMSHYKKGDWCDVLDGLYWRFIAKHRDFYARNPRMKAATSSLDRMKPERKERIFSAAEEFIQRAQAV